MLDNISNLYMPRFSPMCCYASVVYAMALCVSLCHKLVFCGNCWANGARFGIQAATGLSYIELERNFGTLLWKFVPNCGFIATTLTRHYSPWLSHVHIWSWNDQSLQQAWLVDFAVVGSKPNF